MHSSQTHTHAWLSLIHMQLLHASMAALLT